MTTATQATIVAVLKAAKPGDTITLTGTFAALRLSGIKPAGVVTLDASAATFTGQAYWTDVSNLTVVGGQWQELRIDRGANIEIDGATFGGQSKSGQVAFNAYVGYGVSVVRSTFANYHKGATFTEIDGATVHQNIFTGMQSDGVNFAACRNVSITSNDLSGFAPVAGTHPDAIQGWSVTGKPPTADVLIARNIIDAAGAQGIFLGDLTGAGGFDRVTIEDNDIRAGQPNGLAIGNGRGSVVRNNRVSTVTGSLYQSRISIIGGTVTRCGNTVSAYGGKPGVTDPACIVRPTPAELAKAQADVDAAKIALVVAEKAASDAAAVMASYEAELARLNALATAP